MNNRLSVGQAYLFQAKEDLCAVRYLGRNIQLAPSSFFMLLQMVFEKLAKAAKYWKEKRLPASLRHEAADAHFSKRIDAIIRMNPTKQKYYNHLIALIKALEAAQPSVAKKVSPYTPMLEYPWENRSHSICYPARDLPLVQKLKGEQNYIISIWHALKFAQEYAKELEAMLS